MENQRENKIKDNVGDTKWWIGQSRSYQIGNCIPLTIEKTRTASEDHLPLSFPFEYSIVDCRKY